MVEDGFRVKSGMTDKKGIGFAYCHPELVEGFFNKTRRLR
jgi:hypothetical protein